MAAALLAVVAGVVLVAKGAEAFVANGVQLARRFAIPQGILSILVLALGTSLGEFAVSVLAALEGNTGIAYGNVLGSNLANSTLVLGVLAVATPLAVRRQLLWLDVPWMIGVTALLVLFGLDGSLTRIEAGSFLVLMLVYVVILFGDPHPEPNPAHEREVHARALVPGAAAAGRELALFFVGAAALIGGAKLLTEGAVYLALAAGMSELVVGATLVAFGTSVPEIFAAWALVRARRADTAVGTIIGSNICNILVVLGCAGALAGDIPVPAEAVRLDLPVVLGVTLVTFWFVHTGQRITRREGVVLLLVYVGYVVLRAGGGTLG